MEPRSTVIEIGRAAARLRAGDLVVFPTETVYGLGANAGDPRAVARIFEAKGRPRFNPLIVHLSDIDQLHTIAREIPALALRLAEAFWPGPLTLLLPRAPGVPDLVTAGLDTVGVRIPQHPVARALITAAGVPVAAPSANPYQAVSPTRVEDLDKTIVACAAAVIDGGPCAVGVESTVVGFDDSGRAVLHRLGGLPVEELERITGALLAPGPGVASPGRGTRHYSPARAKILLEPDLDPGRRPHTRLLCLRAIPEDEAYADVRELSPSGDLRDAARNLFTMLNTLDRESDLPIAVRLVPATGLGAAINDRLLRATGAGG